MRYDSTEVTKLRGMIVTLQNERDSALASLAKAKEEVERLRDMVSAYNSFYVLYENSGSWSYDSKEGISYWRITDDECNALDCADREIDRTTPLSSPASPVEKKCGYEGQHWGKCRELGLQYICDWKPASPSAAPKDMK